MQLRRAVLARLLGSGVCDAQLRHCGDDDLPARYFQRESDRFTIALNTSAYTYPTGWKQRQ